MSLFTTSDSSSGQCKASYEFFLGHKARTTKPCASGYVVPDLEESFSILANFDDNAASITPQDNRPGVYQYPAALHKGIAIRASQTSAHNAIPSKFLGKVGGELVHGVDGSVNRFDQDLISVGFWLLEILDEFIGSIGLLDHDAFHVEEIE